MKKPIDIHNELRVLKDSISRLETALHNFGYHVSRPSTIIHVQSILDNEPAFRSAAKKSVPLIKRGGKMVAVSIFAIRVADQLPTNPRKNEVLLEALRLLPQEKDQSDLITQDGRWTKKYRAYHRQRMKAYWTPQRREQARQDAIKRARAQAKR